MNIKVLLVEDHELTRKGIAYSLKTSKNIDIIAEVDNGKRALDVVKRNKPDIILMDIAMPVMNGIDATKEIHLIDPEIKIIMLTSINEKKSVLSAFHSGANAYCLKDVDTSELLAVINTVMSGAVWIDPHIANYILDILQSNELLAENSQKNADCFHLTAREKEILKLISQGKCNKDIAQELVLSLHTVKNHVKNIIQKLAVDDRTQAAIMALQENLI